MSNLHTFLAYFIFNICQNTPNWKISWNVYNYRIFSVRRNVIFHACTSLTSRVHLCKEAFLISENLRYISFHFHKQHNLCILAMYLNNVLTNCRFVEKKDCKKNIGAVNPIFSIRPCNFKLSCLSINFDSKM